MRLRAIALALRALCQRERDFFKKLVLKGGCSLSSAFPVTNFLDGCLNNLCLAPVIAPKVQIVLHLAFGKPSAFSGRVHEGGRNENTDHRLGHHDCFSGDVLGQRDAARLVISGAGDAPLINEQSPFCSFSASVRPN